MKLIIFLILFFLIKSEIGIRRPNLSRIKEYLSFGLPLTPRGLAFWLINLSDRYIIAFFLGASSVGIYSPPYGLGSLPYVYMSVLTFVLFATLPQLYDEGRMSELKTHLRYSLKYLLLVVIPFVFGATILAEPILKLFTTSEIASQGHTVLPLVALAASFLSIHNIIWYVLILAKKTKILAFVWVVAAVLNIGLNILLVPLLGIIAAAITTLIAYSMALALVSYYSFKELQFDIDWHFIIKSLIASAIMALIIWLMPAQSNSDTVTAVLIGVIVYGVVISLLKGFTKKELSFFRSLLRRRRPSSGLR